MKGIADSPEIFLSYHRSLSAGWANMIALTLREKHGMTVFLDVATSEVPGQFPDRIAEAIGAIAHRLCRLVWKILHDGVTYEQRGPVVSQARAHRRAAKTLRELRRLGYRIELTAAASGHAL